MLYDDVPTNTAMLLLLYYYVSRTYYITMYITEKH